MDNYLSANSPPMSPDNPPALPVICSSGSNSTRKAAGRKIQIQAYGTLPASRPLIGKQPLLKKMMDHEVVVSTPQLIKKLGHLIKL